MNMECGAAAPVVFKIRLRTPARAPGFFCRTLRAGNKAKKEAAVLLLLRGALEVLLLTLLVTETHDHIND